MNRKSSKADSNKHCCGDVYSMLSEPCKQASARLHVRAGFGRVRGSHNEGEIKPHQKLGALSRNACERDTRRANFTGEYSKSA